MSVQRLPMADAPPLPPLPPRARYARTGTYRRCAGLDCGAVKPAAAFAREDGKGFYAFCGTCRGDGPDSRAAERAAARAAARDAKRAADRQAALERRFFVRQLRKRASA